MKIIKKQVRKISLVKMSAIYFSTFLAFSPLTATFAQISANVNNYDFEVREFNTETLEPNQEVEIPIKIDNLGTQSWYKDDLSGTPKIQLSYKITDSANNIVEGEKTDLLADVLDISAAPNNILDANQKLKIKAPDLEGSYSLEVMLFDNEKQILIESSNKEKNIFNLLVEIPLTPDITSPTGALEIIKVIPDSLPETETIGTNINIKLTANDPQVDGALTSGISEYILSDSSVFANSEWLSWSQSTELVINRTLQNIPGEHSFYVKFKDAVGNISQIYSDTINFVSTAPIGSIEVDKDELVNVSNDSTPQLQVQDNNLKIYLNATSNVGVSEYKLAYTDQILSSNSEIEQFLNNHSWNAFTNTTLSSQQEVKDLVLTDETGSYYFFVKYKNLQGQESEIYSTSINYQKYNITPELTASSQQALFAGDMEFSATIKNSGEDIGYNARIEVVLPKGFSFIEPMSANGKAAIIPTFISTNQAGNQILVYQGVADLLTGESVTINSKIKVGGQNDGYKIGDIVPIQVKGQLFKRSNFITGFETNVIAQVELKPFIVNYNEQGNQEHLVGDIVDNNVEIRTNEEIPSDESQNELDPIEASPLVVEFELTNGVNYVDGSQQVLINGVPAAVAFQIVEMINSNPILVWMLGQVDVNTVIQIFFQTEIEKIESQDEISTDFVDHNEELNNNLLVSGDYTNPCSVADLLADNCEESKEYSEIIGNNITAKYFDVQKWSNIDSEELEPNSIITYTIRIETSKYYDLTGIEIIDLLPDGVSFDPNQSNLQFNNDIQLDLFDVSQDTLTGETKLVWRINNQSGIEAGTVYQFSYDVRVNQNYTNKNDNGDYRIVSDDILTSLVTVRGVWSDINNTIREETVEERIKEETATTNDSLSEPKFEKGIKLANTQDDYSDNVMARIGDKFDIYTLITFPENTPTKDFNFRTYLPVGTKLVEDSLNVTPTGTFSKDPTYQQSIAGGYLFDLGKVEGGSTFRIDYQIEVLDDANLKEAVIVRNLFRVDYKNIVDSKFTFRDEVTLNLIEPIIQVRKRIVDGYLARGEISTVELRIKNTGHDSAYNLNLKDTIPNNTVLINVNNQFSIISNLGNTFNVVYNDNTQEFEMSNFDLLPSEQIIINYQILTNEQVIFGDKINSIVTVSEYSNRPEEDTLIARNYPAKTYNFNWKAAEPLLITDLNINPQINTGLNVTRDQQFKLKAIVKTVGKAPVYNTSIQVDVSFLTKFAEDINSIPFKLYLDEVETLDYEFSVSEGVYIFEGINLGPNSTFQIDFDLTVPEFADFDSEYLVSISAIGKDKLGNNIRKDGSNETNTDTDSDDRTEENIKIVRLSPSDIRGEITFQIAGQSANITNQSSVDTVTYQLESQNKIVGVRFSNDGINWYTHDALDLLDNATLQALGIEGNWNVWNQSNTFVDDCVSSLNACTLSIEGNNYKFVEVVDLQNYTTIVEGKIIKDTTAPAFLNLSISPFEGDLTNPEYTALQDNYLNFYAYDTCVDDGLPLACAGIAEFSYSTDNQNWSEWLPAQNGLNSYLVSYPVIGNGQSYFGYLKVRDAVGNEYLRQTSALDPYTDLELQSNIVADSIKYTNNIPQVTLNLNKGAEYTADSLVELGLEIIQTPAGIQQIRYHYSQNEFDINAEWFEYVYSQNLNRSLNNTMEDGVKEICVQVMDNAGAVSNIACDSIILDNSAPTGFLVINNGEADTEHRDIVLNIAASDPNLFDGTLGVWGLQMQFSKTGEDCALIINTAEKAKCDLAWTSWENYSSTKNWALEDLIGDQRVYLRLKDALGNLSSIISSHISYNPIKGSGNIIINNNDAFTNSKYVNLDLTFNMSEFNCNLCTRPALMRFYESSSLPDSTLPVAPGINPTESELNGWTNWQEYSSALQWDIDKNNVSYPNFGYKTVYVQYLLPNTTLTDVYYDSIIYAPYYSIDYYKIDGTGINISNTATKDNFVKYSTYQLDLLPSEVLSQESFNINFNAKNTGSFTWPAVETDTNKPVRITYIWKRTGGELPEGWTLDLVPTEIRGNSVILPEDISWQEQLQNITLKVNTPIFPGEYELLIDAVHESTAWFRDWGNFAPKYDINVLSNPDKPLSPPDFGDVMGETDAIGGPIPVPYNIDSDGWIDNCEDYSWDGLRFSGRNCGIHGIWQAPRDTGYHAICEPINGGHYEYEIVTENDRVFFFCPGNTQYWDTQVGSQVGVEVHWNTRSENSLGGFRIIEFFPVRKTWDSRFEEQYNDAKLYQTIPVNRSQPASEYKFTIQPRFFNAGTAIWTNTNIELVAINKPLEQGGVEVASPFYDPATWRTPSRLRVNNNASGYGRGSVAAFTFDIRVPESMPYGLYKQCFVMTNDPWIPFERRDSFCITMDVQMTQKEQGEYSCPLPHPVYKDMSTASEIIGYIQQNTQFIIKGREPGWSLIIFPTGDHQEGWVEDNASCFTNIVIIDNVIPTPVFDILPQPTGDTGIVIRFDGVIVRTGPDDRFTPITDLDYGDQVQVIGEAFIDDNNYGGWLLVRLPDGTEGWVPKGTIAHVNDPPDIQVSLVPDMVRVHICGTNDIPVYPAPGVKSYTVGTLKPGQNIGIIMKWQNWFQVYLNKNGDTGWVENLQGMCEGFVYPKGENYCGGALGYPYERDYGISNYGDYGMRPSGFHDAVDIPAPYGTPVLAVEYGIVKLSQRDGRCSDNMYGAGIYVDIYHPRLNLTTRYLHLSEKNVNVGDEVFKGMIIGKTGNTGCVVPRPTASNPLGGTHLHFRVFDHSKNSTIDPKSTWVGGNNSCEVGENDQTSKRSRVEELIRQQEQEWANSGSYTEMPDWRGQLHLWSSECKVWVKDYQDIKSGDIDVRDEWTNGQSGGALIYNHLADEIYLVANGMWLEYIEHGGPCGKPGLPIDTNGKNIEQWSYATDRSVNNGIERESARYQRFQNGTLYWYWYINTETAKSFAVLEKIFTKYKSLGEWFSHYGYPISEEYEGGCQLFEFDSICRKDNSLELSECIVNGSCKIDQLYTNNEPTLENLIQAIKILETYYDNATITGLLFRYIFEPEGVFDASAPDTIIYKRGNELPKCNIYNCENIIMQTLGYISYLSKCDTLEEAKNGAGNGCDGKDGGNYTNLNYVSGSIEPSHLFAGISEQYFEAVDPKFKYGSLYLGKELDKSARTYIGDLGGVVQKSMRDQNMTWVNSSDEFKQYSSNFKVIENRTYEGLILKADLDTDIDSYMINNILSSNKNMNLSQSLINYYLSNESTRNKRYTLFAEQTLGYVYPNSVSTNQLKEIAAQSEIFAIMFDYYSFPRSCILGTGIECAAFYFLIEDDDFIYSIMYTGVLESGIFYDLIANEIMYEKGLRTTRYSKNDMHELLVTLQK